MFYKGDISQKVALKNGGQVSKNGVDNEGQVLKNGVDNRGQVFKSDAGMHTKIKVVNNNPKR